MLTDTDTGTDTDTILPTRYRPDTILRTKY